MKAKCLLAIALTTITTCRAASVEAYNCFVPRPVFDAPIFVIVVAGTVSASEVDLTASTSSMTDPYADIGTANAVTTSYLGGNTYFSFSGSTPKGTPASVTPTSVFPTGNGLPHEGLIGSVSLQVLALYWQASNGDDQFLAVANAHTVTAPPANNTTYITMYNEVTSNGATTGSWTYLPTIASSPLSDISVTDPTTTAETLNNNGYIIDGNAPPTNTTLDSLNWTTTPPPEAQGTTMTADTALDGQVLQPVPEPAPVALCLLGCFGFLFRRRLRSYWSTRLHF